MRLTYMEWKDVHTLALAQSQCATAADIQDLSQLHKELFSVAPNELGKLFELWTDASLTTKLQTTIQHTKFTNKREIAREAWSLLRSTRNYLE